MLQLVITPGMLTASRLDERRGRRVLDGRRRRRGRWERDDWRRRRRLHRRRSSGRQHGLAPRRPWRGHLTAVHPPAREERRVDGLTGGLGGVRTGVLLPSRCLGHLRRLLCRRVRLGGLPLRLPPACLILRRALLRRMPLFACCPLCLGTLRGSARPVLLRRLL